MDFQPAVYILTNRRNGTLYTGVTSNLPKRIWEHRQHLVPGFTEEHGCDRLVYFEMHATMEAAITREKQIKAWRRSWKLNLIESVNPDWLDLWEQIIK